MSENPKQEIKKLKELLGLNLVIPNYQRPYKWNKSKIEIFLNDILNFAFYQNKNYRIGSLIFHNEKEDIFIVDGQQRLTTLYLILSYLEDEKFNLTYQSEKINKKTIENIEINYAFISNWFNVYKRNSNFDLDLFKKCLLEKCEFVILTVCEINDAFQLFDSQNTRGKTLNPEDLLKAFHLQKMQNENTQVKIKIVEKWESLIDNTKIKPKFTLNKIFSEHLYRIRNWAKGEADYYFSKDEISEFKGMDIENCQFNYFKPLALNIGSIEQMKANKVNQMLNIQVDYPFLVTQKIINGKNFFEYVFYFQNFIQNLFTQNNADFQKFYNDFCLYSHSYRIGDYYIRNAYENCIILFANHFNETEMLNFYKSFYKYFYVKRLRKRVQMSGELKTYFIKIFEQIDNAYQPIEFNEYIFKKYKKEEENIAILDKEGKIEKFITE
jgi:uncharacterized protein with ParB-like and HNH nuclease domain